MCLKMNDDLFEMRTRRNLRSKTGSRHKDKGPFTKLKVELMRTKASKVLPFAPPVLAEFSEHRKLQNKQRVKINKETLQNQQQNASN